MIGGLDGHPTRRFLLIVGVAAGTGGVLMGPRDGRLDADIPADQPGRDAGAARRFFGRALSALRVTPSEVVTDRRQLVTQVPGTSATDIGRLTGAG